VEGGAAAGAADAVNEPANLALVAAAVANILGRSPDWVAEQTSANADRLLAGILNSDPSHRHVRPAGRVRDDKNNC